MLEGKRRIGEVTYSLVVALVIDKVGSDSINPDGERSRIAAPNCL